MTPFLDAHTYAIAIALASTDRLPDTNCAAYAYDSSYSDNIAYPDDPAYSDNTAVGYPNAYADSYAAVFAGYLHGQQSSGQHEHYHSWGDDLLHLRCRRGPGAAHSQRKHTWKWHLRLHRFGNSY